MTIRKKLAVTFTTALIFMFTLKTLVLAGSPGDLDTTFNSTGVVTTSIGNSCFGEDIALQSDGKIVIVGSTLLSRWDFVLVRYNTNGSLDTSFDTDGKVITDLSTHDDGATAVAIQSDNKIVATGYALDNSKFNYSFAVVRYNDDGSLDSSFGNAGIVLTSITNYRDEANDMVLQPDGKIVVTGYAGYSILGNNMDLALVRYNSDGSLDTSFDTDGKVITDFGSDLDVGNAVVVQADGKIVISGGTYNGVRNVFALARYNTNGSLDTTFNSTGVITTAVGNPMGPGSYDNGNNYSKGVSIQPDGKIVVTGLYDNGTNYDVVILRYNSNGSLDTSFNNTGIVTTNIAGNDEGHSVALQPDGKIVVAGHSNLNFAVIRYSSSGSIDTGFGVGGKASIPIGNVSYAKSVIIQPDGKILAGGYINPFTSLVVARYLGGNASKVLTYLPIVYKH